MVLPGGKLWEFRSSDNKVTERIVPITAEAILSGDLYLTEQVQVRDDGRVGYWDVHKADVSPYDGFVPMSEGFAAAAHRLIQNVGDW